MARTHAVLAAGPIQEIPEIYRCARAYMCFSFGPPFIALEKLLQLRFDTGYNPKTCLYAICTEGELIDTVKLITEKEGK